MSAPRRANTSGPRSSQIVEQVIRPTGLLDPEVEVRPVEGQIDDLMEEIRLREARQERVLVTTLTKRMAEDLTDYLQQNGRQRAGICTTTSTPSSGWSCSVTCGLASSRCSSASTCCGKGLDLPEVSLVAILDADKEGFLRSETSLIQTIGRAARNAQGKVIMYADTITPSMRRAIDETERRRAIQQAFNEAARHRAQDHLQKRAGRH